MHRGWVYLSLFIIIIHNVISAWYDVHNTYNEYVHKYMCTYIDICTIMIILLMHSIRVYMYLSR